jgi:hypothetical protein
VPASTRQHRSDAGGAGDRRVSPARTAKPSEDIDARGLRRRCKDDHQIAWTASGVGWRTSFRGLCSGGSWWEQTTNRALKPTGAPGTGSIELNIRYAKAERPFPVGRASTYGTTDGYAWVLRIHCRLGHTGGSGSSYGHDWQADVEELRRDYLNDEPVDGRLRVHDLGRLLVGLKGWRIQSATVECPKCVAEVARFAVECAEKGIEAPC